MILEANTLLLYVHGAALVGTGIMAGIFFIFSNVAMQSLATLPHPMGMRAMQAVNDIILNPWFLGIFFISGLLAIFILLISLFAVQPTEVNACLTAASLLYIVGCFLVTAVKNVPMNKRLARFSEQDSNSQTYWQFYLHQWTKWNHVRTASSILSTIMYTLALMN